MSTINTPNIIYRGEDLKYNLVIKDDEGTAIDIDTLQGIVVLVYSRIKSKLLAKFSLNTLDGYELLTVVSAPEGKCQFTISAESTENAEVDEYICEVKIDDAQGELNTQKGILGRMLDCRSKSLNTI